MRRLLRRQPQPGHSRQGASIRGGPDEAANAVGEIGVDPSNNPEGRVALEEFLFLAACACYALERQDAREVADELFRELPD